MCVADTFYLTKLLSKLATYLHDIIAEIVVRSAKATSKNWIRSNSSTSGCNSINLQYPEQKPTHSNSCDIYTIKCMEYLQKLHAVCLT